MALPLGSKFSNHRMKTTITRVIPMETANETSLIRKLIIGYTTQYEWHRLEYLGRSKASQLLVNASGYLRKI